MLPNRSSPATTCSNTLLHFLFVFALTWVLAACRFPRDTEGTLERVTGNILHVGLTENPPWVINNDGTPSGIEVQMVQELARELDARVAWHWGEEGSLVEALRNFQLDLVVGGVLEMPWLSKIISMSTPFFEDDLLVGFVEPGAIPASLEGIRVAVPAVNAVGHILSKEGARPVPVDRLSGHKLPVAAPLWWLRAHGYEPGPWRLQKERHVWLLPNGENGWIMRVEKHLARYGDIRLRLAETGVGP